MATTCGQVPDWVNPLVHEGEVTSTGPAVPHDRSASTWLAERCICPCLSIRIWQPATTTKSYDITNASGTTQSTFTEPFYTTRIDRPGPSSPGSAM